MHRILQNIIPGWMGVLVTLLLILSCINQPASAQNPQVQFDQATQALKDGKYQQALDTYHKLENEGHHAGPLYLNMGLSYIRIDSLGKAKYYLLKASQFDETRRKAEQGLSFVNEQFSRQSAVLPKLPWERVFDWMNREWGSSFVIFIGLLFVNLGIFGWVFSWFKNFYTKWLRYISGTVGGLGLLIVLTGFYLNYRADRYHTAVMVTEKAQVRAAPTQSASLVNPAYEGYTFTVDEKRSENQAGWVYVRMSNGQYGWIPKSEILIL